MLNFPRFCEGSFIYGYPFDAVGIRFGKIEKIEIVLNDRCKPSDQISEYAFCYVIVDEVDFKYRYIFAEHAAKSPEDANKLRDINPFKINSDYKVIAGPLYPSICKSALYSVDKKSRSIVTHRDCRPKLWKHDFSVAGDGGTYIYCCDDKYIPEWRLFDKLPDAEKSLEQYCNRLALDDYFKRCP